MASITRQHIGKYTYLYESVSYRDELGRPRNKKTKIGTVNPITGDVAYTAEYLQRSGLSNGDAPSLKTPSLNCEAQSSATQILDSVKCYGIYWFLRRLAENIGLWNLGQQAFPEQWLELFTLACYLIVADKPVMYCEDWLAEQDWPTIKSMSSQNISDILASFREMHRYHFYRAWCQTIQEREYVALDITSISSYSKLIADCEWGHNRDHERLPQVNLCLLYGMTSRLPVFQTHYSGSLSDVTTLENTLSEFQEMLGERDILTVMDKGFFSAKNVNMLLRKNIPFLLPMSFSSLFARQQVLDARDSIDQVAHIIHTSGAPIRGVHRYAAWGKSPWLLHVHAFFDPERALKERNELFEYVAQLKDAATANPHDPKLKKDINRYLTVSASSGKNLFTVREDEVNAALETTGWLVLLSSHIESPQEAYDIYRRKDGVEKSFWKYKNLLGLERVRVHSDLRMQNKTFVAFLALILSSHIHNVMKEKQLYQQMTFDKLFLTLAKWKSASLGHHHIVRPLTKQLRDILSAFNLALPVG